MSYSCADFVDTVIDALSIEVPLESADSPSDQADLVLEELARRDASAEAMLAALNLCREQLAAELEDREDKLLGIVFTGPIKLALDAANAAVALAEPSPQVARE